MTGHRMRRAVLLITVLAAACLTISDVPASAGDPRAFMSAAAPSDPRVSVVPPNDPRVTQPLPNDPRVLGPSLGGSVAAPPPRFNGHRPVIISAPTYIIGAPASSCLAPGYWSYQWVPQTYSQSLWVPGQWTPDGIWIGAHYESHTVSGGSYQPIWVPESWAC